MQDLIRDFVIETLESLDTVDAELLRFEREPTDSRSIAQIYRLLHTIKGTCGFLSLHRLERLAHAAESLIDSLRDGAAALHDEVTLVLTAIDRIKGIVTHIAETGMEPPGGDPELVTLLIAAAQRLAPGQAGAHEAVDYVAQPDVVAQAPADAAIPQTREPQMVRQNVRVTVDRLDHLMNMVSELVLVRNQLIDLARRENAGEFKLPLQRLSHITSELQDGVMRTRMQSIGAAWSRISRTVRDLSADLGKDIRVETTGADTEIDRQILEVIKDCIVHLIRNAADHGIELPAERLAAGKPATGTIRLRAGQEGGHIIMEVADDGRGLDLDRIRAKAYGAGIVDDDRLQRMSDAEIGRLIFAPGFSTSGEVTNMSGRGIGLDAVRTSIESVGGTVDVHTRHGRGTSIILRLPLTLAIAGVLLVEAGGQRYALPQVIIAELVRPQPGGDIRIEHIGDALMLRMRDALVPVVDLAGVLGRAGPGAETGCFVVLCDVGRRRFGLIVDAVHQTEDVVVKPIPARMRHIPYFSGATILGDGSVILILEPMGFAAHAGDIAADEPGSGDVPQAAPAEAPTSLLIFRAGDERLRAVPLALVARLEEFDAGRIEQLGPRHIIQYQGHLLPLIGADPRLVIRDAGLQPVLVFSTDGRSIGVAVDEIVDVIDARLAIDLTDDMPGYLGSAIIQGAAMPIYDVAGLFGDDMAVQTGAEADMSLLLLEGSDFFRALLEPLLAGAGFRVSMVRTHDAARQMLADHEFTAVVINVDDPAGLALAAELQTQSPRRAGLVQPIATRPGPALAAQLRGARLDPAIGKFDRRALLAALGAVSVTQGVAA